MWKKKIVAEAKLMWVFLCRMDFHGESTSECSISQREDFWSSVSPRSVRVNNTVRVPGGAQGHNWLQVELLARCDENPFSSLHNIL